MSLNLGGAEWKALAIKWSTGRVSDEEKTELTERMSRAERKKFTKLLEDVEAKKVHSGDTFVTGRQLSHYFGSYTEQAITPIAHNLDELSRQVLEVSGLVDYLMLPFYRKWWVKWSLRLISFNHWLNRHGIRFVQLNEETMNGDPEILTDTGSLGEEPQGVASDATEARESSPQHGLSSDGIELERGDGGARPGLQSESGETVTGDGDGGSRIIASSRG